MQDFSSIKRIIFDSFNSAKFDSIDFKHRKEQNFKFLSENFDSILDVLFVRYATIEAHEQELFVFQTIEKNGKDLNLFAVFEVLRKHNFFSNDNIYLDQIGDTLNLSKILNSFLDFIEICESLNPTLKFKELSFLNTIELLCWHFPINNKTVQQKLIAENRVALERLNKEGQKCFQEDLKRAWCFKNEYLKRFFFAKINDEFIDAEKHFFILQKTYSQLDEFQGYVSEIGQSIKNNSNKSVEITSALFANIDSYLNIRTYDLSYIDGRITMPDGEQFRIKTQLYHIFNFLFKKRISLNAFSKSEIFKDFNGPVPNKITEISDYRKQRVIFDKYIETIGKSSLTKYRFKSDPSSTPQD